MVQRDDTASGSPPRAARLALVLGIISLSSPLALNMYVPAFPAMAAGLGAAPGEIQLSLTALLAALALGQNFYGPLSDRFGRKPPLLLGLGLFILASVGVALAGSLGELVAWRFVQGFGACAGIAIPRAVVRDLHTGAEAARILAMMLLVISVAPLLAPLLGSALAAALSWRWIFAFMAATGALAWLLAAVALEETLPRGRRSHEGGVRLLAGYRRLLGDRHFVGLNLAMSLSQAAYFAFLGGSPFVFMTVHGLDGFEYGLLFGGTAAFWAAAAQFAPAAIGRFGPRRVVVACALVNAAALSALLAVTLAGITGAAVIVAFPCFRSTSPPASSTRPRPSPRSTATAPSPAPPRR
jgi:DHA1 family bicyclomycin/chloramphenicol resistance-like MFS transporter